MLNLVMFPQFSAGNNFLMNQARQPVWHEIRGENTAHNQLPLKLWNKTSDEIRKISFKLHQVLNSG